MTPTGPSTGTSTRLSASELIAATREQLQGAQSSRCAFVVITLNRGDRLFALAQQARARPVMLEVLTRLKTILRAADLYCMASHDELWLLLRELPSSALVELATRTLQQSMARPIALPDGSTVRLQPHVGAALLAKNHHADPMLLLQAAAGACTRARKTEDHVEIVRLDTDTDLVDMDTLAADLGVALSGNELEVHFQPQVSLSTNHCIGVESLVRWNCPKRGFVNPQLIANLCEERGMMPQLTQFVLNTSLRHTMFWQSQGVHAKVAINVSASSLSDSTFPIQVAQAIATWDADPKMLTLELTESAIVENEAIAIEFMNQLADQGCRLALDDFGTGYSSFAYLRQFPLHELKIDQSFVRHIERDKGDRRIVSALVDLAHTFEMQALAEGIENESVANLLRELGCDLGQGWAYAKALPSNDFIAWFKARALQLQAVPTT